MAARGAHHVGHGALLVLATAVAPGRCEFATDASSGQLRIVVGTVERVSAEGCWRLRADDGTSYELRAAQAPSALLRDGARVRAAVVPRNDLASACGAGTPADVEQLLGTSL